MSVHMTCIIAYSFDVYLVQRFIVTAFVQMYLRYQWEILNKHVDVIVLTVCKGKTVFDRLSKKDHETSSEYSMFLVFYIHGILLN